MEEAWPQTVRFWFKNPDQIDRAAEIVSEVEHATGLAAEIDDSGAIFRGNAQSNTELLAVVETALPNDWADHFHPPDEPEAGT